MLTGTNADEAKVEDYKITGEEEDYLLFSKSNPLTITFSRFA